ncbi:hypothetical protein Tco_0418118 [Tanacetum coccineum]
MDFSGEVLHLYSLQGKLVLIGFVIISGAGLILPPVSPVEIHAVEKERKARTILLMAIPKEHLRRFHGMDDAKEIWVAIRTRSWKERAESELFADMDDGVVNWGDILVEEERHKSCTHAISSNIKGIGMKAIKEKETIAENIRLHGKILPESLETINSGTEFQIVKLALGFKYSQTNEVLIQLNAGRPKINSVRPNINTGRTNINSVRPNINTGRTNINSVRPNINTGRTNINSVRPNINTGRTNINSVRPNINTGRTNINSVRPNINTGRVNVNSVRPNVNTGRVNVNSVRPNVNTGRVNVNSVKSNVNTGRTNVNPVRPRVNTGSSNVNTVRSRQPVPTKTSTALVKRPQGTVVKTSAGKESINESVMKILVFRGMDIEIRLPTLMLLVLPDIGQHTFWFSDDLDAPGPSRNSPKHVSFQLLRESIGSNDMVHNYHLEEAKKKAQL